MAEENAPQRNPRMQLLLEPPAKLAMGGELAYSRCCSAVLSAVSVAAVRGTS